MKRISIIIPCYNEQETITRTLTGILGQTVPLPSLEVILADGHSSDGTREKVEQFRSLHPELAIRIVDNPTRTIPAGLNRALRESTADLIIRLDAHSIPAPDYAARCVADLEQGLGDNIGGVWDIRPGADTWTGRSIALAASSRLGAGDAGYRLDAPSGAVDTVPFGAFRRETLEALGGYDETLLTNEDYELNTRIRARGGIVWLDNAIRSVYFSRASYPELARQYWRYGYWKAQMLRRHPETLRWRQALPPLLVLGIIGLPVLSAFFSFFLLPWTVLLVAYGGSLAGFGLWTAIRRRDPGLLLGIPVALILMHILWGSGLLTGLLVKPVLKSVTLGSA